MVQIGKKLKIISYTQASRRFKKLNLKIDDHRSNKDDLENVEIAVDSTRVSIYNNNGGHSKLNIRKRKYSSYGQVRKLHVVLNINDKEEIYHIFRTVQGYNLYQISLLSERGGATLEIYIRKELQRRLKLLFNRFKDRMIRIGVNTEKDFFSIARRHFSFLFTKKYVKNRKKIMREVRHILALIRENPFDVLKDYDKLCKGVGPP